MPSLKKATTEKVFLPSTADLPEEADRVWFELKTILLLSDYAALADEGATQLQQAITLLTKVIVDWNLTDADDPTKKLDITHENVDAFAGQCMSDFKYLSELIAQRIAGNTQGLTTEEKKTLSSDLNQATATTSPPTI